MTELAVFSTANPRQAAFRSRDFAVIEREVARLGAHIERWGASHPLKPGASPEDILVACTPELDRLKTERGYRDADVVSIKPGDAQWPALRQKFLGEPTHDDDEAPYFVEGSGAFYLHIGEHVYRLIGEAGDLLSVPTGVTHGFDGGVEADFTGDPVAKAFPTYEKAA